MCSKDLKKAPLPYIFFCVKNITKIKYQTNVIVSHGRDLAVTANKTRLISIVSKPIKVVVVVVAIAVVAFCQKIRSKNC